VQTFHESPRPGESATRTMTRLHVSLGGTALFRVQRSADHLSILLAPGNTTREASELRRTEVGTKSAKVSDVKFERTTQKPKKDRVLLAVTGKPGYALKATKTGRLRLELQGADLPKELERVLDVTAYGSKVRSITAFRDPSRSVTIIEIDRDGEDKGEVYYTPAGDQLVWAFDAPEGQASPIAGATPPKVEQVGSGVKPASVPTRTVARETNAPEGGKVVASILDADTDTRQSAEAGFVSQVPAQAANGRYRGRRIDLDLKDADIHNVLRLLADVGRVNVVTADDVAGNVTIRMRNVPWDQALDVVLQAKGLGMLKQGNLIRVAPLAALQKERELRLAAAKQEYELTPLETRLIPVSYASADDLQARAKDLLSPRGTLAVDERTNVLIARDVTQNLNFIEELVRSLDTQTPQVLVEARIVEATSNYLRDVGIQWGGDASFSEATGNPTGVGFPSKATFAGGNYDAQTNTAGLSPFQRQIATPNFAVNLPAAVGTGQGGALGMSLGSADGNFNVSVRLSAAEASGMVRIVSSPR
ncbi:MAG: type IV pilus secretin PilQ, partial [Proteobacteria bacterium]